MKKRDTSKNPSTRSERLREASQQRREQGKQEVRQAILEAASELFLKHGYQHFSLRQVAEQIGYSPGTIYLYFKDKDEVLFTIMDEGFALFGGMLTAAAEGDADPRQQLSRIGRAYIDFGLHNPAYYQLMFMQRTDYLLRSSSETLQPHFAIFGLWQQAVEEAMKAGVLRMGDPAVTSDTLWALLHGVVSIALLMPNLDEKRIHEMTENALEMIASGLHKM
ncbi:MAG: TetR/AcrR family transcriptional regulator [Chitinophagaceae bacterium]|nr:TetR/AcrR family transcriptional regulator [Anaerolineae bacterium]